MPEHQGCYAHTFQLCVKDGLKVADGIQALFGKVAKLVSHVRKSTIATELLEDENRLQMLPDGIASSNPYDQFLKYLRKRWID